MYSYQMYNVGWISAIEPEFIAARAALDEIHPVLESIEGDDNHYTFGKIGPHFVVVTYLPSGTYGMNAATQVATQMKRTFRWLRFGLLVGIGGGVPGPSFDIRLGDVAVSHPVHGKDAVIQYDLVKRRQGEEWPERIGQLNKPPDVLLKAISSLKARHRLEPGSHMLQHHSLIAKWPALDPEYTYPGAENDVLFEAEYRHENPNGSCRDCDGQKTSNRPVRLTQHSVVHYGTIASGNQVVKDSVTRDHWRDEAGVICFEMEAAGLVDSFDCITIRGICDYADSHKNDLWQPYAAAVAAAYAKDLLLEIAPLASAGLAPLEASIQRQQTISSAANGHADGNYDSEPPRHFLPPKRTLSTSSGQFIAFPFSEFKTHFITAFTSNPGLARSSPETSRIFSLFRPSYVLSFHHYEYERDYDQQYREICVDTCQWLLQEPRVKKFLTAKTESLIWFTGKPGLGKTTLMTYLHYHLSSQARRDFPIFRTAVLYSFCNTQQNSTTSSLLSVAIHQLLSQNIELADLAFEQDEMVRVEGLKSRLRTGNFRSSTTLWNLFTNVVQLSNLQSVILIVDALDQCDTDTQSEVFRMFSTLPNKIHLFVSSRYTGDLHSAYLKCRSSIGKCSVHMNADELSYLVKADIQQLIQQESSRMVESGLIPHNEQSRMTDHLERENYGLFLPVATIIKQMAASSPDELDEVMSNDQQDLSSIYRRALSQIQSKHRNKARQILKYVAYSFCPFTVRELEFACNARKSNVEAWGDGKYVAKEDDIQGIREILRIMTPLIGVNEEHHTIQFFHPLSKEFLEEHGKSELNTTDDLIMPQKRAHQELAMECLELLNSCSRIVFPPKWGHNHIPLIDEVFNKRPLLLYVLENWARHLKEAFGSTSMPENIKRQVLRLNTTLHSKDCDELKQMIVSMSEHELIFPFSRKPTLFDIFCGLGLTQFADLILGHEKALSAPEFSRLDEARPTEQERFSLGLAIQSGAVDTVQMLMDRYKLVSLNGPEFQFAYPLAAFSKAPEMLELLLDLRDRRLNELVDSLKNAIVGRDMNKIRLLLQDDYLLKAQDESKRGVLHLLVTSGWHQSQHHLLIAAIDHLAGLGVDINMQDAWGLTPLIWVIFTFAKLKTDKFARFVHAFLEIGADPTRATITGWLPLHAACWKSFDVRVAELLLYTGGLHQVSQASRGGLTPLHWAASRSGDEETATILELLLRSGADPHVKNKKGISPIERARLLGGALESFQWVYTRLDGLHQLQLEAPMIDEDEIIDPKLKLEFALEAFDEDQSTQTTVRDRLQRHRLRHQSEEEHVKEGEEESETHAEAFPRMHSDDKEPSVPGIKAQRISGQNAEAHAKDKVTDQRSKRASTVKKPGVWSKIKERIRGKSKAPTP